LVFHSAVVATIDVATLTIVVATVVAVAVVAIIAGVTVFRKVALHRNLSQSYGASPAVWVHAAQHT